MDKTTERIKADAEAYANDRFGEYAGNINDFEYPAWKDCADIYIAGATAENNMLDKIFEDTMQRILNIASWADDPYKATLLHVVHNAQEQWSGTGKEVEPVKEIEYMPIHPEDARKPYCPRQFPMNLLDEQHAQRNHGQTLQKLKERGGLGVLEILSIVNKKPWSYYRDLKWDDALRMLNDILTNPPK